MNPQLVSKNIPVLQMFTLTGNKATSKKPPIF